MKKIVSLVLAISMILTMTTSFAVMAEETEEQPSDAVTVTHETDEEEIKEYTLSLEAAIELALTENPQLIANEYGQNANKINIKSANLAKGAAKKATKKFGIVGTTTVETLCMRNGYYVSAAQMQYDLSVIERERIVASISYNTTKAYYNVVLIDMLLSAAQNSYNIALENKKVVDAQYEQGLVAELFYENAGISVDVAKSKLEAYQLNKEIALSNLKNILNVPENSVLILTDTIKTEEFSADVDADINSAMETRYDIISLKRVYELSEEYFENTKVFTESSAVYNTAYADTLNKKYQYDSAKDGIALSIKNSYNTILTNHSAMDIAKKSLEMKEREYEVAKLKYDLGMITNLELTDCIYSLYEAEVAYCQAEIDYTMSVEKYKYDITIGLPQ